MRKDDCYDIKDGTTISEQASHWWVVLHSENVSPLDHREFGEWVSRSPERIAAWLQTEQLMRALQSRDVRWPDISAEELIREAQSQRAQVVPLAHPDFAPHSHAAFSALKEKGRGGALLRTVAIAAAILVAVASGWFFLHGSHEYETGLGEQHSVVLDDGSLVTLNTASKIVVDLDKDRRLIHLLAGEALFQVAHDKTRPFEVIAGEVTVRAVGTQFNIDRRASRTTVTVIEGKVLVDEVPVATAERVIVVANKVSRPERVLDLAPAVAWTQRRLVFERRPLGDVAEEFNRYNRQVIEIESPELRQQKVTGVFQANDPDSFVTFLSNIPGVTVSKTDDGTHIIAARESVTSAQ